MLNDVQTNKDALQALNVLELDLDEQIWEFIEEYVRVFAPVHTAMLYFQKADITMSDFYLRWIRMQIQIGKELDGPMRLKTLLQAAVNERAKKFFECDAFIAALLLDPRFTWSNTNAVFNDALRERGTQQLEKILQAIIQREQIGDQGQQQAPVPLRAVPSDEDFNEMNFYAGGGQRNNQTGEPIGVREIRDQVAKFLADEPRLSATQRNFNILEYWHAKRDKNDWKQLYKVSQVVYGAAFSQVKVERDFSGFALVLTHLRSLLADDTLNSIILVKNNLDLLDRVNFF